MADFKEFISYIPTILSDDNQKKYADILYQLKNINISDNKYYPEILAKQNDTIDKMEFIISQLTRINETCGKPIKITFPNNVIIDKKYINENVYEYLRKITKLNQECEHLKLLCLDCVSLKEDPITLMSLTRCDLRDLLKKLTHLDEKSISATIEKAIEIQSKEKDMAFISDQIIILQSKMEIEERKLDEITNSCEDINKFLPIKEKLIEVENLAKKYNKRIDDLTTIVDYAGKIDSLSKEYETLKSELSDLKDYKDLDTAYSQALSKYQKLIEDRPDILAIVNKKYEIEILKSEIEKLHVEKTVCKKNHMTMVREHETVIKNLNKQIEKLETKIRQLKNNELELMEVGKETMANAIARHIKISDTTKPTNTSDINKNLEILLDSIQKALKFANVADAVENHMIEKCTICLSATSNVALDCGHLCMCEDCYYQFLENHDEDKYICPICRSHFNSTRSVKIAGIENIKDEEGLDPKTNLKSIKKSVDDNEHIQPLPGSSDQVYHGDDF